MFKKKIINIASVDLTKYSPAALRKIRKIKNCATVFLPENPSNEFMEAYTEISLENVANVIKFPEDKVVCNFNGTHILKNISPNNIYIINGDAIIVSSISDEPVQFISNGSVLYSEDVNIDFISMNGIAEFFKCDYENLKIYNDKIEFNADFIRNSQQGTSILCQNKIKIAEDVTEEMFREKELYFICMNKIYCKKEVYGYIAANAKIMNKIVTDEEEYMNWDKKFI